MKSITAVLSMLHEPVGRLNSATRLFRTEPVLAWTLHRIGKSRRINQAAVLCWDDQLGDVEPIAEEMHASVSVRSPRVAVPQIESVAAARRWADGWRGGLLGACEFDRGFHGPWVLEILEKLGGDAVALVDPAAGLIDPVLVDRLIEHAETREDVELCFSQAAPGLSAVLLRAALVRQLAAAKIHPGSLLCYRPDLPRHDPIAAESCAPVPTVLARTTQRFTLDSDRQIERICHATEHLNGQLISTEAEQLFYTLQNSRCKSSLPREVVLELTARRATRPIFQAATHCEIQRGDLSIEHAGAIFAELARADDCRLTFAGAGDPLLHPKLFEIVELARKCGIGAMSLETDLVGIDGETIDRLAESAIDIVSVYAPATTQQTYKAVMGTDSFKELLEHFKRLIDRRQSLNRGTPLVVPTFVKCAANAGEMEYWYDHWLKLLGCAVISGPSTFAELIPNVAVAEMAPPRRRACNRLSSRMTILSDGQIATCEQDVMGRHPLGKVGEQSLAEGWIKSSAIKLAHEQAKWDTHPLCAACSEWHRP